MAVSMTMVNSRTLFREPRVTTVALISNQYLVQLGVERAIEAAPHINLVGHADREVMAEALLARTTPQVVLLDMESGFDTTALVSLIRGTVTDAKIIALCGLGAGTPGRGSISSQVDAVVLTVQPTVVLIATIDSLCHTVESPHRLGEVGLGEGRSREEDSCEMAVPFEAKWPDVLTLREREVVELVAQGMSNKAIAAKLCISTITVRHHLTNIFDKLGVSGRQNLLIHAHRCGFVVLKRLDSHQMQSLSFDAPMGPNEGIGYPT